MVADGNSLQGALVGTDPALHAKIGGPLELAVESFYGGGYKFDVEGWVFCSSGGAACHP